MSESETPPAIPRAVSRLLADRIAPRIEAAARLMNERQYEEAKQLYEEVLEVSPNHPLALVGMAHVAILDNQIQRGFDILAAAASLHCEHPTVLAGLAHGHELLNHLDDAAVCLERVIELDPFEPVHRVNLANVQLKQGRTADALSQLETALAMAPDHAGAHNRLGVVYMAMLDLARAEQHFRRALAADDELSEAAHNLASVLSMQGCHDAAVEFAERAYLQDPGRPEFQTTLIGLLADTRRLDEAGRLARRCLALAPHDVDILETAARVALLNGEGDAAFRPLAAQVRRSPTDAEGIAALARTFAVAGRLEDALKFAEEVLRVSPDHPNAAAIRKRLLFALDRPHEARAGSTSPSTPPACYYIGPHEDAGEALLFSRFLRPQAGEPDPPMLLCHRRIGVLLAHVDGLAVYESETPPLDAMPLVSGASLLTAGTERMPGPVPYLAAHPDNAAYWAEALARFAGLRIGLAWSDRIETLGLADVVKALPPGATVLSLMDGERRHDLAAFPGIVDAGAEIEGYADLVAAVAGLDFIVACDGVAAHLAGSLGKSGVVVVPENLPWCWAHADGRSFWYPSLHVLPVPIALKDRSAAVERLAALCTERLVPVPQLAAS